MSLMARVPKRTRVREGALGVSTLALLPLVLGLPGWMLAGVGPVTTQSACPPVPGPGGCTPLYAARVSAVIDALAVAGPLIALATVVTVLVLVVQGRRAWVLGLIGAALTAAAVLVRIDLATVNAGSV